MRFTLGINDKALPFGREAELEVVFALRTLADKLEKGDTGPWKVYNVEGKEIGRAMFFRRIKRRQVQPN